MNRTTMNTHASSVPAMPVHLFDADAELSIVERRLPHWSQAGAICFITWRTNDSMPKQVLDEWYSDRNHWLRSHGINPADSNWRARLAEIDRRSARDFLDTFWNRWHDALDAGHGKCVLRRPDLSEIVAKSLRHFDGERYVMLDYVVMPNHVHLRASFPDEGAMVAQCESWKHFMAVQINRRLDRKKRFWEQDAFDHLLRSEEQFHYLRRYIAENPAKARLGPGESRHYSKPL